MRLSVHRTLKFFSFFILFSSLVACQTVPTQIKEKKVVLKNEAPTGEFIKGDFVIVDARPPFEYNLSHVPQSISLTWTDFTQKKDPKFRGLLEDDYFSQSRRLARLGISPDSPVIVVGNGHKGQGEEGRLAWNLNFLGVKNVQISHIDQWKLKASLDNVEKPMIEEDSPKKEPIWKPQIDPSLKIDRKTFLAKIKSGSKNLVLIDTRIEKDYLAPSWINESPAVTQLELINIPWKEFINAESDLILSIKDKLKSVGITEDKEIVVLDEEGISAGLVVFSLRKLGYPKSSLLEGGYNHLLSTGL